MRHIKLFLVAVLIVAGSVSCDKDGDLPKPLNLPEKAGMLIEADNAFGLDLYGKLAGAADAGTNLMISPLSVSQALTMAYNGAKGQTAAEMAEALKVSGYSLDELNELNRTLVNALLAHDPKVVISVANSIWYRQEYSILPDFIYRNQTYYNAEVLPVDFAAPGCKDMINKWVADKTNQRIPSIIDQINPESFMFLINAIYFKGAWANPFDKKQTAPGTFYPESGPAVAVEMMHGKRDLNVLENSDFTSVELPYGKGNWRMFLFLPSEGKKLAEVEKQLTPDNWKSWLTQYDTLREVTFSMPKFTFSWEESLNNVLQAMGMETAFTDMADLSGIKEGGGLLITEVKHKTFVEVNEEGTEAAAVTSVEVGVTSIGNFITINRPFLFAIAERSTGTILFLGRLMQPGA